MTNQPKPEVSEMECRNCGKKIEPGIYSGEAVYFHIPSGNRRCDGKSWYSRGRKTPVAEPAATPETEPAKPEVKGIEQFRQTVVRLEITRYGLNPHEELVPDDDGDFCKYFYAVQHLSRLEDSRAALLAFAEEQQRGWDNDIEKFYTVEGLLKAKVEEQGKEIKEKDAIILSLRRQVAEFHAGHKADLEASEAKLKAMEEVVEAGRKLAEAMETCHICKGLLVLQEDAVHCEDCSYDCEGHDEPECTPIYALHAALKIVLGRVG